MQMRTKLALLVPLVFMGSKLMAQVPPVAPDPAQVVLIFKSEPKEFKSIMLDKKPFASLEVGMEHSTTWPVSGGKHQLVLTAPAAEEKKIEFSVNPKDMGLLFVDIGANPDSAKVAQFPKAISLSWLPMNLPEPDKKSSKVYAYLPIEMKGIRGDLFHGSAEPTKTDLVPGKLTPLGEGKTGFKVGQELLLSLNPGAPGLYVGVIFLGKDGKLRSVPFSIELLEQEPVLKPGETKPKGPPEDY
jgi:hypothetical protein